MNMKRTQASSQVGLEQKRWRTTIEYGSSQPDTDLARAELYGFLQELAAAPYLLNCGPATPQKLGIHHSGEGWTLTAEAVAADGG